MAVCYNSDFKYANAKLSGSVVRYDGQIVYVVKVYYDDGITEVKNILSKYNFLVPLKDLDLSPIPLGYCNFMDAIYVSRCPVRDWKQGLKQGYIYNQYGKSCNISTPEFYNMVVGIYPTIVPCINMVYCENYPKQAFSRVFALGGGKNRDVLNFFYKDYIVGELDVNNGPFPKLHQKYKYLSELVGEEIYG